MSGSLAAYLMPHPTSVQVDTDRSSVEAIIASLEQQGITVKRNEQVERALFLSGYEALDEIEEFENGLLYVQDTASMLAVELAAPKQGDHVIDVCAAPGGKSIHLAEMLDGTGSVESRDLTGYKTGLIEENISRYQIKKYDDKSVGCHGAGTRVQKIQRTCWSQICHVSGPGGSAQKDKTSAIK